MKTKYAGLSFGIMLLTACGGGGNTNSSTPNNNTTNEPAIIHKGALSVLVSDDLSTEYSKVWVAIKSVYATNQNNERVSLFDNKFNEVVNLSDLYKTGKLLNSTSMPVGSYSDFQIELSNHLALVDPAGQVTEAKFDSNSLDDSYKLAVPGDFSITKDNNSSVTFDFDLKNFTYDATTGEVSPHVRVVNTQDLSRTFAEIEGSVESIEDAQHFTLRLQHNNQILPVTLHPESSITDEDSKQTYDDTTSLKIGDKVDVYGNFNAARNSIQAINVQVNNDTRGESNTAMRRYEVEGIVRSSDGTSLTLEILESDFFPTSNSIEVVNLSNAYFSRGSLDVLTNGQRVEIAGNWDGNIFSANTVEIEGAVKAAQRYYVDDAYAEVEGRIVSVNGPTLILKVTDSRDSQFSKDSSLNITINNAWIKNSAASCFSTDDYLEVKGHISSGEFHANFIESDDNCREQYSFSDDSNDDRSSSDDSRDSSNDDRSSADDSRDSSNDDRSSADDSRDSSNDDRSSSDDSRDSSNDDRSSADDSRDSSNDDRSSADDSRDSSNDDRSSADDSRDSSNDDRSSADDSRDSSNDDRSSSDDDSSKDSQRS